MSSALWWPPPPMATPAPNPLPGPEGLSTDKPISFTLLGAEARAGSALWLRYQVNAKK